MRRWSALAALLSLLIPTAPAAAPPASEIVQKADEIRVPVRRGQDFVWSVTITSSEAGKTAEVNGYEVFAKGFDRVLVRFVTPPREAGRSLLALDRDLWIYLPAAGKPVRIPLAQRLVGRVANGDIARVDYAGDYDAELLGSETVDGRECYVLRLSGKTKDVTYASLKYWVAKDGFRPVKAEFYALSGKLLKTGTWDNYRAVNGRAHPMRLTLVDAISRDAVSVLDYSTPRVQPLPEKMFNKNYMKQLE